MIKRNLTGILGVFETTIIFAPLLFFVGDAMLISMVLSLMIYIPFLILKIYHNKINRKKPTNIKRRHKKLVFAK